MRALLMLVGLAFATQGTAGELMHVDGVRVYGRVHDVSVTDIHEALAAISGKPGAVEVIGSSEMHVYLQPRALGWVPMRHVDVVEPDGSRRSKWMPDGRVVWDTPEAMNLIRTADEVYVFPVTTPLKPHRNDRHLRLLDTEARQKLVSLLGEQENWFHGLDDRIRTGDEPTNTGFLFRHGNAELILFFSSGDAVEGTFNGGFTRGSIVGKSAQEMEGWKRRYAQPELAEK